ncbi:N-acetyltransferase [Nocardia panacis]|uniref:N-acetyltransferase n=1 Tax=Nocardia panacis TaxID=2340916 RepID=A0A3A4KFT9_9NOCA|nr:GNAT family protein [Nocardia panacis]RJO72226.1 N-acetyltransferase [Nocardia panacis]
MLTLEPMRAEDANAIRSWRYAPPYDIYDLDDDSIDELLDPRSPHYCVRDVRRKLVGFFSFGSSSLPWHTPIPTLYGEDGEIGVGLGMHPAEMGGGSGVEFVRAGVDFARNMFQPKYFHLFVYVWNARAIRVYERAGFHRIGSYRPQSEDGGRFWEMRMDL